MIDVRNSGTKSARNAIVRAAAVSIAAGLGAGVVGGIVTTALGYRGASLAVASPAALYVTLVCFLVLLRQIEYPATRPRWRDLQPSHPLYRSWRDLRKRWRLFMLMLLLSFAVHFAAAWGAPSALKIAVESVPIVAVVLLGVRLFAWPCPRCDDTFLRHRRWWYLCAAVAAPLSLAIVLAVGLAVALNLFHRDVLTVYGSIVFIVLGRLEVPLLGMFAGTYGTVIGVHNYRDNFARRQGDPDWIRKASWQCIHCGFALWSAALPP
jgi:hypothetical protein